MRQAPPCSSEDRSRPVLKRCAIYTRKSTEHNLDLEFNSLHAQREACEAYVKSQIHEGWQLIPDCYDDGGISGATLNRPDLERLIHDIKNGRIDIVVVYKVDRLTRSLADFAKLVEIFDSAQVSFVSVTQAFNTTNSMGRLTLNVLLSFAQFEREVIGERVRDKIAASKAKGIWVGGPLPIGYACQEKKVIPVPNEAAMVRLIFERYLALGSVGKLKIELEQQNVRSKEQKLTTGRTRGGVPFSVGGLTHLLQNRFYIGEYSYRGKVYRGEHQAIIETSLFEAVQQRISENRVAIKLRTTGDPALLVGRIRDDRGNCMTPVHAVKKGARYRYYVSQAIVQRRKADAGSFPRVSAPDIEKAIVAALRMRNAAPDLSDLELVRRILQGVVVENKSLCLTILNGPGAEEPITTLRIPWAPSAVPLAKGAIRESGSTATVPQDNLLQAIAKARKWMQGLISGYYADFAEIADKEGKCERHVRLLAPLAYLSPGKVDDIAYGHYPATTITRLAACVPLLWDNTDQPGVADRSSLRHRCKSQ